MLVRRWNKSLSHCPLGAIEKVRGEFLLMCLAHNVKKMVRLVLEDPLPWFGWHKHKAPQAALSGHKLEAMALAEVQM